MRSLVSEVSLEFGAIPSAVGRALKTALRGRRLWLHLLLAGGLLLVSFWVGGSAQAQQEIPPPRGKGRVVLVLSGVNHARHEGEARRIAALGYYVVWIDSRTIPREGAARYLRGQIEKALQSPHALPGKAGLVGYSMGGGRALMATAMPDVVGAVVAWYPVTADILNPAELARAIEVPTLMLAAEYDREPMGSGTLCCSIENARALAAAATGKPLELVVYRNTQHSFIANGAAYKADSYSDASKRTAAWLEKYLR